MLGCTRCEVKKPETLEFFPPHNKKKNGLDSWCRSCRSSYRSGIRRGRYRNSISDIDLIKLLGKQKSCTICGKEAKMVVDHDHLTGKVRGLLCDHCNRGLGHFKDNIVALESAIKYLKGNS